MRMTIFKVIMFLAAFVFMQGVILPWTVSNNMLPLWLDIVIFSCILMGWVAVLDRIGKALLRKYGAAIQTPDDKELL